MYVTLANKMEFSLTTKTKIYYLKVVGKQGTKLMGWLNGIITIKMAALVLSGEEFGTALFLFVFPATNTGKCQVWIVKTSDLIVLESFHD